MPNTNNTDSFSGVKMKVKAFGVYTRHDLIAAMLL